MAAPVVSPVLQWLDANGKPYANGTITTYVVGTGTPKATFADPGLSSANPNPIILDAAGRSLMWGDGDYRLVLHDAAGNLVFDQPATTIVSAAMAPVVSAPTIADAWAQLGGAAAIAAEATARANADSTEQNARTAADTALGVRIDTEATNRTNADANLQTQINAIPSTIPPPPVPSGYSLRFGNTVSASNGYATVTFTTAFPNACDAVVATAISAQWWTGITAISASGFTCVTSTLTGTPPPDSFAMGFFFIAVGH